MIDTLCLSGGGTKGICYIGAIKFLEENNYINLCQIKTFLGTSVGSILCFFFSIGFSTNELKEFVLQFDFCKFEPKVDSIYFLSNYGLDNGEKIMTAVKTFLFEKFKIYDISFKELYEKTKKELKIFSTNYTKSRSELFSYKCSPNLSVIDAIRMSISVPFLFTPVKYNDCIYIDGGITNNFPIRYCDLCNSLGITIINREDNEFESLPKFLMGICSIAIDSISLNQIQDNDEIINKTKYNYFEINCRQKDTLNFALNKDNIENLLTDGYDSAEKFYIRKNVSGLLDDIIKQIEENLIDK